MAKAFARCQAVGDQAAKERRRGRQHKKDEGSKKRRILTQEEYEAEEKAKEKKEKEEKEETERLNIAKWMMMSDEELIKRLGWWQRTCSTSDRQPAENVFDQ